MKNTAKKVKIAKVCLGIVIAAAILTTVGVIINFIQTGLWDAEGCSAAGLNCALVTVEYNYYTKCLAAHESV